jgi:hypothetical protein
MIAIVFLGISASAYFRRNVTRQLERLIFNMDMVAIGEDAMSLISQDGRLGPNGNGKVQQFFLEPANVAKLKDSFRRGEYKGGMLLPAPGDMWIPPTSIRDQYRDDPDIEIGDVRLIVTQYRPRVGKNWGVMRFIVKVSITKGQRTFEKKLARDHSFKLMDVNKDGLPEIFLSDTRMAKVFP